MGLDYGSKSHWFRILQIDLKPLQIKQHSLQKKRKAWSHYPQKKLSAHVLLATIIFFELFSNHYLPFCCPRWPSLHTCHLCDIRGLETWLNLPSFGRQPTGPTPCFLRQLEIQIQRIQRKNERYSNTLSFLISLVTFHTFDQNFVLKVLDFAKWQPSLRAVERLSQVKDWKNINFSSWSRICRWGRLPV
jgi:hypothetical protein